MDKKDNIKDESFNDPLNWKSLGFFSAEDYLLYIFKKTEKITSAVYLVSGLLKDDEPLKWELRDKGMDLISSSFGAASSVPGDKNAVIQSLFTAALETLSLLNVAKISNLISDMNHKLLVKEIDQIVGMLRDKLAENAESAGYILSESFFKTPDLYSSGFREQGIRAGHVGLRSGLSNIQKSYMNKDASLGHRVDSEKKNHRQEMIINLMKGQASVSIKDLSKNINDCSEKTIQRELIDMLKKGVIKKEGDRRWSRYSLS